MTLSREQVEAALDHLDLYAQLYPENYTEEKERFFDVVADGDVYNPQYTYSDFTPDAARPLLDTLSANAETALQKQLVKQLRGRQRLMDAIGGPAITDASEAVYGAPDDDLVAAAQEQFQPHPDDGGDNSITAEVLQDAYAVLFGALDMDYTCRLVEAETIRNDPHDRAILIPQDGTYGVMQAKRVLIHESTHSVRTYNGIEHGDPALIYGTDGYAVAEEGLPTFNEDAVGVFADTRPRITSRVIAVAAADKPFHDLYRQMRDLGLSQRLAFIRTYRVKRGLADTGKPGGFIKDHIYFQGYSTLQEQPDLAEQLYVGKIGFSECDAVDAEPVIPRDRHLAAYRDAVAALS